jgi:RNA polymerase sigma-70 factor (ECF subfamily)
MTAKRTLSPEELLCRAAAGDEEAFALLYRQLQGGVYRFALQMSGSTNIAEEVVQEAFMVLIRDAKRYDPARGALRSFLYGVARNHVLRCIERDTRYIPMGDDQSALEEPLRRGAIGTQGRTPAEDFSHELVRRETIGQVRQAVLALPAYYREVVVLCELQGMSYEEAAGVIGCALGTVRSRLHRARELLQAKLRVLRPPTGNSVPAEQAEVRGRT